MKRVRRNTSGSLSSSCSSSYDGDDNSGNCDEETSEMFRFATSSTPACLLREREQEPTFSQQQVQHDVYGLEKAVMMDDISFELVQELERQIAFIENKPAYNMAMEMNPDYPRSLMVAFLRSTDGSPKRASKRLTRHFETKLKLFGRDKLVKPIEIIDLDEYDLEALYSGGFQVLPAKDRAGRPMLFGRYTCMKYRGIDNMLRVLFYIWSTMVEDERHQITGVVAIGFENGKLPLERFDAGMDDGLFDMFASFDSGFDRDLARGILSIPLSVPIRPMGYHICADNSQWESIFDMVLSTICKFTRLRIRFHYGTMQETKYAMMTHGIPVQSIPVTPEGDVDLTNHLQWIEHRKEIEEARRTCGYFITSNWGC